jgi:hypothetical protein
MNYNYILIPKGITKNKNLTIKINKLNISEDQLAFAVGYIFDVANNQRSTLTKTGYVNISSEILKHYNSNYSIVIDFLLDNKIIERDYYEKNKCFGYRVTDTYLKDFEVYEYKNSKFMYHLGKKLKNYYTYRGNKPNKGPIYLTKWFNKKLEFEYNNAMVELNTKKYLKLYRSELGHKYCYYPVFRTRFEDFKHQYYRYSQDDVSGRFHSSLTNLKKEFKKYFKYEGKELYQIDVVNCQPYLLQMILDLEFWESKLKELKYVKKIIDQSTINKVKDVINSIYIMFPESELSPIITEVDSYIKSVNEGTFYEDFIKLIKKPGFNRSKAKTAIYQTLFSHNKFYHQNEFTDSKTGITYPGAEPKRCFYKEYPTISKIITIIKSGKNKANLALLLQNIESYIIIEKCCYRISKEKPECLIFTIHDSISTTAEYLDYVRKVMEEEFEKFVGVPPEFSTSKW